MQRGGVDGVTLDFCLILFVATPAAAFAVEEDAYCDYNCAWRKSVVWSAIV